MEERPIKLKEWADKTGQSELDIAKKIITFLAIKAETTGRTQKINLRFPKNEVIQGD